MAQHGGIQLGCQLQLTNILLLLILSLCPLLLYSKSQRLPQEYFLSLIHLFSHVDLGVLDVHYIPYTKWHMVRQSVPRLSCFIWHVWNTLP